MGWGAGREHTCAVHVVHGQREHHSARTVYGTMEHGKCSVNGQESVGRSVSQEGSHGGAAASRGGVEGWPGVEFGDPHTPAGCLAGARSAGVELDDHCGDVIHHPLLLLQPLGPGAVHKLRAGRRGRAGRGSEAAVAKWACWRRL
jgi:hypothetical protein